MVGALIPAGCASTARGGPGPHVVGPNTGPGPQPDRARSRWVASKRPYKPNLSATRGAVGGARSSRSAVAWIRPRGLRRGSLRWSLRRWNCFDVEEDGNLPKITKDLLHKKWKEQVVRRTADEGCVGSDEESGGLAG